MKIKTLLKEQTQIKDSLIKLRNELGLDAAIEYVGGVNRYIKLAYDNDVKEYFKNEPVRPYQIKEGDSVNMYFDNVLVEHLNLEDIRDDEKKLGDFRYGAKNDMRFSVNVRLIKLKYMNGTISWKVVGISGSQGFGYSFINKREVLGNKYRKQIFQQIIDKYNLKDYQ